VILVDANVLIALASRSDQNHKTASQWVESTDDALLVPPTVIAEVCFLVGERNRDRRAEVEFLRSFADPNGLQLAELTPDDLARMADLTEQYATLGLGGTDASVIAIAERLGITEVATFDRRHFPHVQPNHVQRLTLLP
jgi:predicted nucleic acid-binding protein